MRRRRHLHDRLNRLDPPPMGGGVLYLEDVQEGLIRLEDLPKGPGGWLVVPRPMTVDEWKAEATRWHETMRLGPNGWEPIAEATR